MGNALSTAEAKPLFRKERMCQAQSAGAECSRAVMAEPRMLQGQASSLSDCSRFGKAERQKYWKRTQIMANLKRKEQTPQILKK